MRTPSPLPAPALWGEPHRWGWAKGRALRLGPSAAASSAAQPRARGLPGSRASVGISCRWARTPTSGKKRHLPKGLAATGRGTLSFYVAAETATVGGCRPPGAPGSLGRSSERTRVGQPSPPASSQLRAAAEARGGRGLARRRAGRERSREPGGCSTQPRMAGGRSTGTSLFGQSTDLTARPRENIR